MALYEIQYRGADLPEVRLKSALVIAPDAEEALEDVGHLIRHEDRRAYVVKRVATTGRTLLFTSDEW
jgi:hypothetical protein